MLGHYPTIYWLKRKESYGTVMYFILAHTALSAEGFSLCFISPLKGYSYCHVK